ncbi:MAG: folate family ECF transporter S component [bacterium]|nr:folate family ECF transporter S component [bacterium]
MVVKRAIYIAFLSGLSIVLSRILSLRIPIGGIEGVRIGFGPLPIIITSFLFGPIEGALCGAISDILGYFINPMGPYVPAFTIISMMRGILPSLLILRREKLSFKDYLIGVGMTQVLTSMFLVPLTLHFVLGLPLKPVLIPAIISQVILIPIYSFLSMEIINALLYRLRIGIVK